MGKFDKLKKEKDKADQIATISDDNLCIMADEHARVAEIYENAAAVLDNIDREFERQTGLSKTDIAFLFFAVALQCVRQYILTPFEERHDDQTEANKEKKGKEKHS